MNRICWMSRVGGSNCVMCRVFIDCPCFSFSFFFPLRFWVIFCFLFFCFFLILFPPPCNRPERRNRAHIWWLTMSRVTHIPTNDHRRPPPRLLCNLTCLFSNGLVSSSWPPFHPLTPGYESHLQEDRYPHEGETTVHAKRARLVGERYAGIAWFSIRRLSVHQCYSAIPAPHITKVVASVALKPVFNACPTAEGRP